MMTSTYEWEKPLLSLARVALQASQPLCPPVTKDRDLLERAYAHCASLTAHHSRSFSLASRLLPPPKRRAVHALYAFCRTADDIVDHPTSDTQATLRQLSQYQRAEPASEQDLVAVAWADTCQRFQIPHSYTEQFIQGVARDLYQTRYQSFADLATYSYGVASTVGLMSMHIIGFQGDEAFAYAVKLGVALQLTNILRDVAEDWDRGRLYLPLDELDAFGLGPADVAAGRVTGRWRRFLKFQIERARQLYAQAWPGIGRLDPKGRLAIAAAADFYSGILDDIQAHDYDVFDRRAHLTGWGKLRRLPGLWWRVRAFRGQYQ